MGFQMQFGRAGAPVRALACCLVATMLAGCSAQQARDTAKSLETGAPAALENSPGGRAKNAAFGWAARLWRMF